MASASVPPSVQQPAAEVLPAELATDPDLWLRILSWVVIASSLGMVLVFSLGRDHGAFATVAHGLLQGRVPYRDLWAPEPPGIFLVFASAFGLFGENMAAPRLLEALAWIGVAVSCRRLGGVFFGSRTAGLLGGAAACLVHAQTDFCQTAQPGSFAGPFIVFALVATTHPWPRRWLASSSVLSGALVGIASLLLPSLAVCLLPLGGHLLWTRRRDGYAPLTRWKPTLWMLAGFAAPWVLLALWWGRVGALGGLGWALADYHFAQAAAAWATESTPQLLYQAVQEAIFEQSALLSAGMLAIVAVRPRSLREKEGLLLCAFVLVLVLAGVAFRGAFEPHDFTAALPVLGLLAGVGLYKVWRRIGPGSSVGTLAFLALLTVLPLMRGPGRDLPESFWTRARLRLTYLAGAGNVLRREELERRLDHVRNFSLPAARSVARELRENLSPEGCIGAPDEPLLYWLSGHGPCTRFVALPTGSPLLASLDAAPEPQMFALRTETLRGATPHPTTSSQAAGLPATNAPSEPPLGTALEALYGPPSELDGYSIFRR